jgi:3-hydroxyisobutyrate dehydrogenase-like beta-hydroxyacid dehydrogenase
MIKKLAFIGAGLMGAPMIRRLLKAGFEVRIWNRTPAKSEPLVAVGALPAASPAEAASGADAVLLCLSDAKALETVLFSEQGVVHSEMPPALLVDFSTVGPGPTLEFAARLHARTGTSWVDAPVSGGAVGAEQGKLVILCGGSAADIGGLTSVFNALAQRHTRIGDLGTGQTLKLCNQLIVSSNLAAIAESLALARASGLDMKIVPQALAGGFADSLPLQIFGTRMAAGVTTPVLGELKLMLKDLRAIENLAGINRCELPLMAAALDIYRRAGEAGMLHQDLAALIDLYPAD